MIYPLLNFWIVLAATLVPRSERAGWKQEWLAELSYRQRSGVSLSYLLRSARGAFRDAAWMRAQTPIDFRFLTVPLRAESLLVLSALVLCVWNRALIPPRPDYANLDRLVRFERDLHFAGAINTYLRSPLLEHWRKLPQVEQVASYNVYLRDADPYTRISPNFFDVLGVKAFRGQLLPAADDRHAAVITHRFWRTRFHSDPRAIGSTFRSGKWNYRVVGILGPTFAFHRSSFFTPLRDETSYRTITLLKRGISRSAAMQALPKTREYEGARLQPLVSPFTYASVFMAAALVMLAVTYALLRRRQTKLYICARMGLGLFGVAAINLATFRAINSVSPFFSMVQFWVFCGLCAAVVYFVVRDQRSRCPVCFERLRMPVPIGSWSSLILDRPATEYVCPAGHGVMFVSEALHDPNQWTVLDESWHDLFVETT